MQYIHDAEASVVIHRAFLLLGLLANYNKFEFRNPYKTRLEDFVNEATIVRIVHGLGAACMASRNEYVAIQEDIAAGWTLGTALNYIGLGLFASAKGAKPAVVTADDMKEAFGNLWVQHWVRPMGQF